MSKKVEIVFRLDSPDFDSYAAAEVSRLVRGIANDVLRGEEFGEIRDSDEKLLGRWFADLD